VTDTPEISPGEKFALLTVRTHMPGLPTCPTVKIAAGIWAWDRFPFPLTDDWKSMIGNVRERWLNHANLVLVAKAPSLTPDNIDGENQHLKREVFLHFQTLLLAANVPIYDMPIMATGCHKNGRVEVHQLSELPPPLNMPGLVRDPVTVDALALAAAMRTAIASLEATGGFKRIGRVFGIHQRALKNPEHDERLHQFCRCIEGFILPLVAKTTSQFRSRTELFVGQSQHEAMGRLYEMRSQIEHLHTMDFPDWPKDERERRLVLLRESAFVQELSRYCISRFLLTKALWQHFGDDKALADYWQPSNANLRQQTWGAPADVSALRRRFDATLISNGELGL